MVKIIKGQQEKVNTIGSIGGAGLEPTA